MLAREEKRLESEKLFKYQLIVEFTDQVLN